VKNVMHNVLHVKMDPKNVLLAKILSTDKLILDVNVQMGFMKILKIIVKYVIKNALNVVEQKTTV